MKKYMMNMTQKKELERKVEMTNRIVLKLAKKK